MERVEAYLNLNVSYKDFYIENNEDLKKDDCGIDKIYIAISLDLDIVFSALNIMPSKAGYQYWKEAVFLYMMSGKQRLSICNDIYPLISKKFGVTTMCIDRSMRRCFENVLYYASKNDNNFICAYLKNFVMYPRNSELVVKISELISSKKFQINKMKDF